MAKRYARINFRNAPSVDTPLDEVTLNRMDAAIDELDTWREGLIVDNLASELTDKALSPKQGKILNDKITALNESLETRTIETKIVAAKYNSEYYCAYSFPIRLQNTPTITIHGYNIDGETAITCSPYIITQDYVQFKLTVSSSGSFNPAFAEIKFSY